MIRIDRSRAHAPQALLRGKTHLTSTIEPLAHSGKLRSKDFDRSIYASDEVRKRLWEMQHYKCCFCEREYEVKHSTVEHFRPKTEASDDIRNRGTKRPGYWWLAYTFENLYFCCKNCNTPKATFFPLVTGATPLSPKALPSKTNESGLLLDPGVDDPEPHIVWRWRDRKRGYVPVGITDQGKETIRATELDQRDTLSQIRARYYRRRIRPLLNDYRAAKQVGDTPALAVIDQRARHLSEPHEQFSAMTRYLLRRHGVL